MVTFRQAPIAAKRTRIREPQMSGLSHAINDRLVSGWGDGGYRLRFWLYSLFRGLRNPDGDLTPSELEFFTFYQNVRAGDARYPETGPGEPAGTNVDSPLGMFVFGNEGAGMPGESDRVTDMASGGMPLRFGLTPPSTPGEIWELGKWQRGAWDPVTGASAYPAINAGRSVYWLVYSRYSKWGNSYGGFAPSPEHGESCSCESLDGPPPPNWLLKFTPLKPGLPEMSYAGTCPPCEDYPYEDHVAQVVYTPWAYYVRLNSGHIDVLATKDYIEGPYVGAPVLRKQPGGHFPRIYHAFARKFRGSLEQQKVPGYHVQEAFDFEGFQRTQYYLAPQVGVEQDGSIQPSYRAMALRVSGGKVAAGASSTPLVWHSGAVLTHVYVRAEGMTTPGKVAVVVGGEAPIAVDLAPDDHGVAEAIVRIPSTPKGPTVSIRAESDLRCTRCYAEGTELMPWLPEEGDQYVVLRTMAARPDAASGTDGDGEHEGGARRIWADFQRYGALISPYGVSSLAEDEAINTNAIFDAARQLSRHVRCIPRDNLVAYAVEGGRSVIWLRRYARGMSHDVPIDLLDGIAPAREPIASGDLVRGKRYLVRGGRVDHAGRRYWAGDVFEATRSKVYEGTGTVYEYDGVLHVAPPGGWTNEWMIEVEAKPYWYSDSSIWKPEVFADRYGLLNRCHWGHYVGSVAGRNYADVRRHFGPGNDTLWTPESPSGYQYVRGMNAADGDAELSRPTLDFARSCRVYEPPVAIESATVSWSDGEEIVKLVLTGRLHSTVGQDAGAPETIGRDLGPTELAAIRAEGPRTSENAIREYLCMVNLGANCDSSSVSGHRLKPGDAAYDSEPANTDQASAWDVFGACFPTIWLTQLIPRPAPGGKPKSDLTRCTHDVMAQAELYLRVMCEGFVDGVMTAEVSCSEEVPPGAYDWTWEAICYRAFGGRWIGALPDALRPDKPEGHGPLPHTRMYAEPFNRFARVVNLMTTVRVALPYRAQYRTTNYIGRKEISAGNGCGESTACGTVARIAWRGTGAPASTLQATYDWTDMSTLGDAATAFSGSAFSSIGCAESGAWALDSSRVVVDWRVQLVHPDYLEACPPSWRDMIGTPLAGVIGTVETVTTVGVAVDCGTPSRCFGPSYGSCCLDRTETQRSRTCGVLTSGRLDAGQPEASWHAICMEPDPIPGDLGSVGWGRSIILTPLIGGEFTITANLVEAS